MTDINPQYTFDNIGNPVGVFLLIEDWNAISEELHFDLPQWQKEMIDSRLKSYKDNPADTMSWEEVLTEFDKEDEAI